MPGGGRDIGARPVKSRTCLKTGPRKSPRSLHSQLIRKCSKYASYSNYSTHLYTKTSQHILMPRTKPMLNLSLQDAAIVGLGSSKQGLETTSWNILQIATGPWFPNLSLLTRTIPRRVQTRDWPCGLSFAHTVSCVAKAIHGHHAKWQHEATAGASRRDGQFLRL